MTLNNLIQNIKAAGLHFGIIKRNIKNALCNIFCDSECPIAPWILLETMFQYGKLFNFWAPNIAFYLRLVCKSFLLSSSVFFGLGFKALFEQFYGFSTCS